MRFRTKIIGLFRGFRREKVEKFAYITRVAGLSFLQSEAIRFLPPFPSLHGER
jgi:hypothetical protein